MKNTNKNRFFVLALLLVSFILPANVFAGGFSETLPQGTFLLTESFVISWVDGIWDNDGNKAPIIEEKHRYEPGGGKQGVMVANPKAEYMLLVNQLQYGILDYLTVAIGIPVVLRTKVDAQIDWETGDYQNQLGRAYGEDDFWAWAESMGQDKITTWEGNKGVLSDIILAARFRWTDWIKPLKEAEVASALTLMGAVPTGRLKDPEEILATGTTMWELHTQGDIAIHLGWDKTFKKQLEGRLGLGIDLFYEVFFPREVKAGTGEIHPLMQNNAPYTGDSFDVKPGDFSGFAFQIDCVPVYGPALGTWLTDGDAKKAENLPPLFSFYLRYTFVHLQQTDYRSNSKIWDWEQEKFWRPGYKNFLEAQILFSFLRLGAPFQIYASFKSLSLIPGKNTRAADVLSVGLRIPLKFW